jgi:DNA-binding SARP family transcriptional activator
MNASILSLCRQYVAHIRNMQRCYDQQRLIQMEDFRDVLHNRLMDALHRMGYQMGRQESEAFAFEVVSC